MRNLVLMFSIVLTCVFSGGCKEDVGEPEIPSVDLGWTLDAGTDLFTERGNVYKPFDIVVTELEPFKRYTGISQTYSHGSFLFVRTNGYLPPYTAIDFGNGDVDTLRMIGDANDVYESTEVDFFYNGVLQVSWDLENQVATYHYDSGRQERLPRKSVIGNRLLLLKDSASMADIGFK